MYNEELIFPAHGGEGQINMKYSGRMETQGPQTMGRRPERTQGGYMGEAVLE